MIFNNELQRSVDVEATMRRWFCVILLAVFFTSGLGLIQVSAQEMGNELEMNIQAPVKSFQPGESVEITVTFTNLSKIPQTVFFRMPEFGEGFEVVGEDGRTMPKVYVQDLMVSALTKEDFYELAPGTSLKFSIHCRVRILRGHLVFDCYAANAIDFEKPGILHLKLVYQPPFLIPKDVSGPVWLSRTVSNTIIIEIVSK